MLSALVVYPSLLGAPIFTGSARPNSDVSNRGDNETFYKHNIMNDDLKRNEAIDKWNKMSEDDQDACYKKLHDVCIELLAHPDYKNFSSVKLKIVAVGKKPSDHSCIIRWNGNKLDEVSGWGLLEREIPSHDVPIVTRRYMDRVKNLTKNDGEGVE